MIGYIEIKIRAISFIDKTSIQRIFFVKLLDDKFQLVFLVYINTN